MVTVLLDETGHSPPDVLYPAIGDRAATNLRPGHKKRLETSEDARSDTIARRAGIAVESGRSDEKKSWIPFSSTITLS
jgi:hypothetical protein